MLNGWGGKDTFYGESGNDTFRFSSQYSANGDKVMDFVHGTDKLDFSKIDVSAYRTGDQAFAFDGYKSAGSRGHLGPSRTRPPLSPTSMVRSEASSLSSIFKAYTLASPPPTSSCD